VGQVEALILIFYPFERGKIRIYLAFLFQKDDKYGMNEAGLSVIIPMFNEAENAVATVRRVQETLSRFPEPWEIIAVNDGSTDGTFGLLQGLAEADSRVRVLSYPRNSGRGKALRVGFKAARGQWVVSIDADLSYAPGYIVSLTDVLREEPEVDLVLASPYMPGGGVRKVPFLRLLISRVGNRVLRMMMPGRVYTSTGIFRAYRRKVLESIELESEGKEIHLEILSKAMALGFRVKEFPAVLTGRKRGYSKFHFRKTALSHLIFSFFEKPMVLFGFFGLLTLGAGLLMGLYIAYLRFSGELTPGRPLITFAILLILGGMQILSFGFIALQIVSLRKEILRIQRENLELRKALVDPHDGRNS
jgi:dolichol-phosphate mannosyltransferase